MPQHEDKSCAKCGDIFECKLGSITICHCFDVPLNREETLYMANNYDDCLCHKCLVEEKQNFKIMKDLAQRIANAETRVFKVVFPNTTNHYDTLFGGTAMQLMDEVAFITATRFSRKKMVTVSSSKIDFNKSIPADTIIELVGKVVKVGNTSMEIEVEIFKEEMYNETREQAIKGSFTFVAIGEDKKPVLILDK
jgi:acyl-CoA hydrolase